jgi:hypothetical protein
VDSKAAIQAVSSNRQPKSKKVNYIKQTLKHPQALKKIVTFQWLLSHVGLEGNEIAEKLANKGTTLHTIETPLQADTLKDLLNHKIATKYKQVDELSATKKWRVIHKIWVEYKGKPIKEAAANFRHMTKHYCLAAHLRKFGVYESSECTICQIPTLPLPLPSDQQMLKNTTRLSCGATTMMR